MESSKNDEDAGAAGPGGAGPGKDLSFLWPVIDRISAVEIKFNGDAAPEGHGATGAGNVESRLAALEAEIAAIKEILRGAAAGLAGSVAGGVAGGVAEAVAAAPPQSEYPPRSRLSLSAGAVLSVAGLLLAHWLIVFVYDLKTIVLLLASMLVPLGVAIAFTLRQRIVLKVEIAIALTIGLAAVLGMSYITSTIEKAPLLPQNPREWIETFEYIASISLAYFTGVLMSNAWQNRFGDRQARVGEATLRVAKSLAKATGRAIDTGNKVGKQVKSIQDLINTAMPVGTALVSLIAGVDSVLK